MLTAANSAPASIDILFELRQQRPDMFDKMDIFIDGGVRRGTDVLKGQSYRGCIIGAILIAMCVALCLGAKGVGMGRPFLFANAAYGEAGVVKAISSSSLKNFFPTITLSLNSPTRVLLVMQDEIIRGMRLLGSLYAL